MKTEAELAKCVKADWAASSDYHKPWREEAKECYDFNAGRQISDDEKAELEEQLRPAIVFNRVRPMVSAVKGHEINNRMEARFLPREIGDAGVSELLTSAVQWVDDECDAEDEQSDILEDVLICGMGWSETRIDYDEDEDGKITSDERIDPFEMRWDVTSRKRNLLDARWMARGSWHNRADAEARWPEVRDIVSDATDAEFDFGSDEPHDAARAHFYEDDQSNRDWYRKNTGEVFVVEYQYWCLEPHYRLQDPGSGRLVLLNKKKYDVLRKQYELVGMNPDDLRVVKQQMRVYYRAFLIGSHVLEHKVGPWPHGFTWRCATGFRDSTKRYWFGIVKDMRDPQKWANKMFAEIEHAMSTNRLGGAFVEEGALSDPRAAEEMWSDPNPLIMVTEGAIANGKIMERSPIPYPAGLDRIMTFAVESLPQVTGINQELMGYAQHNQPNILETNRKRAALNVLADIFSNMRRFRKQKGRCLLYFIREYMNDGRLIRVAGDTGEQYVPLVMDPAVAKYDIVVDEAPNSPNQRMETLQVLMQVMPFLAKLGVMPPPDTLEYLPLPESLVSSWKKMLTPKGPDPKQQIEMAEKQADIAETESKTELNRAKTQETMMKAASEAYGG